jgi:PAS domain S-box-containing protein
MFARDDLSPSRSPDASLSVLLIEDHAGDARLIREYLQESEQEVALRWERLLESGLSVLSDEQPDVVAVDLGLPDSEGPVTVRRCTEVAPAVPIVVLTGDTAQGTAREAQAAGAAEYLQKDELTPALLARTLRWAATRARMGAELGHRSAWIQSIADNVTGGLFRSIADQGLVYANEGLARMLGYEAPEALLGVDLADLADNADGRKQLRQFQRGEATPTDLEVELVRPDGTTFTGLLNGTTVDDEHRGVTYQDGVLTDITDRKKRREELRRLSEAVEQTQEAVLITEAAPLDAPGPRIVFTNAAHEEMTGYREDELLGRTPRVLQGPDTDPDVLDSLRAALEAGEDWEGETVNYRKDGTPYRVHWNVAPVRDEAGAIRYWVSVQRDVTEQREQDAARRRQRNLLEQTQRLAGAWEVHVDTGAVAWSNKVYDIYEVPAEEEITTDRVLNFHPPAARRTLQDAFERCTTSGEPYDLELPIVTAAGNERWVHTVAAPVEWEEGRVVKVAGAVQDITERTRAEEALRTEERRFRGLANTLPGVVFQFYARPDGTYGNHFVSERAETVLGISSDSEGFYERFLECIPASHRDVFQASVGEAVEQETTWRIEVPFRRPTGETIWLLGLSTPERTEEELVFNGVLLDISIRKAAEQALQEERDRFVTLFSNLPTPVVRGTVNEGEKTITVTDVNTAFESVFGYAAGEIQGEKLCEFILPSDQATAVEINEEVMDKGALQLEVQRRTAGGVRDFQLQAATRERPDGPTEIYAMYTDVTEQKRRERELKEAKDEAEAAAQLKSAMLANMSHEIRTPLTSIMGFAEVLTDEGAEGDVRRFAHLIARSGRRLEKTLSSVLELSKLEAGVYELDLAPVGLGAVVEETAYMFESKAEAADLTLQVHIPDEEVNGQWNEGALVRITENLLENAIKFTPAGGHVEVRVDQAPEAALLEVSDTGIGMDPAQVPGLFQPFKQESEGLEREYEGTGLGLSIVKRLTEAHGGTVEVETAKGEGTCFTVQLPHPTSSAASA